MKNRLSIFFLIAGAFLPHHISYACSTIPETSYLRFTGDMRHVFVMLNAGSDGLSEKYRSSGLYSMDGSRDPAWEVDWYSTSVVPHSGGRYLIQLEGKTQLIRATGNSSGRVRYVRGHLYLDRNTKRGVNHAISFYDKGELLHEYFISDLFNDVSNVEHHFCFGDEWFSNYVLDETTNTFILTTTENITYTFSITSGELITAENNINPEYDAIKTKAQRNKMNNRSDGLSEQATNELLDIIQSYPTAAAQLGQPFLSDYSLAKRIIGIHGSTYHYFDKALQKNSDLAHLAVTSGKAASIHAVNRHMNDERIYLAAVKHDGNNYSGLPDKLKNNKRLLLSALRFGGMSIYGEAPENLRNDREVLMEALRAQLILRPSNFRRDASFYIKDLSSIPARYLNDERVKQMIDAVLEVHSANYAPSMAEVHKEQAYSLINK